MSYRSDVLTLDRLRDRYRDAVFCQSIGFLQVSCMWHVARESGCEIQFIMEREASETAYPVDRIFGQTGSFWRDSIALVPSGVHLIHAPYHLRLGTALYDWASHNLRGGRRYIRLEEWR